MLLFGLENYRSPKTPEVRAVLLSKQKSVKASSLKLVLNIRT
jgi:hypothetical protein